MKKLGFGCMRLPQIDWNDRTSIDIETLKKMVDLYLERGFTYFDTAHAYHRGILGETGVSERAMREALVKRYPRESFVFADKMTIHLAKKKEDLVKIFNEQLEDTGLKYFNYYLMHNMNDLNYKRSQDFDAFEFIQKKKEAGFIKHIGISFHDSPKLLEKILIEHSEIEVVQLQINYLDWKDDSIQSQKCYDIARKYKKSIIVMEPVKGGSLVNVPAKVEKLFESYNSEKSVASWAIRYAASLEGVIVVLSGMSTLDQLRDNTGYMQEFKPLNMEENEIIVKVTDLIRSSIAIPCTACEYCTEVCPKEIPIPKLFQIYNNLKQIEHVGYLTNQKNYYQNYTRNHGKAKDCIECKKCEKQCPQHIKISKQLKIISKIFDI